MNDNNSDIKPDLLAQALADLSKLIRPLEDNDKDQIVKYFYYLLLLWPSFHIYQLEPPVVAEEGGEGGASGKGGSGTTIPLDNGWKIFDSGDHLSTSPGEEYGTYCTGNLIETTQKMVAIMAKRGAAIVNIDGHEIAKRAAWVACQDMGVAIANFLPTAYDQKVRERINQQRARQQIKQGFTTAKRLD